MKQRMNREYRDAQRQQARSINRAEWHRNRKEYQERTRSPRKQEIKKLILFNNRKR